MHIPKTAGSTMLFILNNKYRFQKTITIGNVNRLEPLINLTDKEKENIKVLKGHFHFGVHKHLKSSYKYITFFREPITRSISGFNYLYQNKSHYFHNEMVKNNYSLRDMLTGGYIKNFDNCQVRFLAGVGNLDYGQVNEDTYNLAIKNLDEKIHAFGICEQFDKSLIHIKKILDWSTPYYVKANISKKDNYIEKFDDETKELLNHYNQYDIKLYDYAVTKFNTLIKDYNTDFQQEVIDFQKKNANQYAIRKQVRNVWLKLKN